MNQEDRVADFWESVRDHGWGSVEDEARTLIQSLEEQLERQGQNIHALYRQKRNLEEQLETLRRAALAAYQEYDHPDEDPPSETYFHELMVELEHVARGASSPAKRPS